MAMARPKRQEQTKIFSVATKEIFNDFVKTVGLNCNIFLQLGSAAISGPALFSVGSVPVTWRKIETLLPSPNVNTSPAVTAFVGNNISLFCNTVADLFQIL